MLKTQTSCPNCRQPVLVDVEQLFDLNVDPQAKQRLLSGAANLLRCPNCNYQGQVPQPMVYHDPEKELLLTFVPAELGLPRDAQEQLIGQFITKVVNALPQEKRKAYLLQPRTMLTFQTLMETVLEGEGITKEMLQAQQTRLALIQRLANTPQEAIEAVAQTEAALLDKEFFGILGALAQNAISGGNRALAERLAQIQEAVLPVSEYGKQIMAQTQEVEAAIASLQAIGEGLTQEKLLDVVSQAPNDTRLRALVSMARDGMDYQFFQLVTQRMERAKGEEAAKLGILREKLLAMTREYDLQIEARAAQIKNAVEQLIAAKEPKQAMLENMQVVDDLFLQVLEAELAKARNAGDLARGGKLNLLKEAIEEASSAPPEVDFIEALLAAQDEAEREEILKSAPEMVSEQLLEMLNGLVNQVESSGDPAGIEAVRAIYMQVLRFSMNAKLG